ncbi:cilia- and flagella-associated protein 57 isoform X2 [Denticeps clupeoides]|uniref:cilia- and flagella-associated protein 57 isoform X2 n=1 Tax=Denticeps clupeoides TaxID=299321 RepID=UPI0010A5103A|nr:cilia- and flagella-associated protein 57 isoform X2 [Denticeps clupeoides]
MAAGAPARPHHIFGLRRGVARPLWFADERTLLLPAGRGCVRYDLEQRGQTFIPGTERSQGITAMAVSPARGYLAVSERVETGTISIYDLRHEPPRRRRVLSAGEASAQEFVSLSFSPDSKFLAGQAGGPDWTLYFWMWEKQKVVATVKTGSETSPVSQVSFSPQDSAQICVSGRGLLKLFRYADGTLKQSSHGKVESHNVLSHAWTSEERVVAGTEAGRLLVLDSGDLRWEMSVVEAEREGEQRRSEEVPPRVSAIVGYSKGFACSAGPGTVCLFEKTEERDAYHKTKEIRIPLDPCGRAEQQEVQSVSISPAEESLVCSTDRGQLYSVTLTCVEDSRGEEAHFEFLSHSFHSDTITGLSICVRKPLAATCSLDHSVRIWNYESKALELCKDFQEEAHSVALHPSGLWIIVGFSDKLRLMNLLMDDIRTFKELAVRGCRECAFSHGGHMFAAVNGNVIHIYSSTTFDNVLNLKGHNRKVQAVAWSADDSRLVSCGLDGAVYEWSASTGRRESESVLKSCSYTGVAVSRDARSIFAVGTDSALREIQDCEIVRELLADDVTFTAIAMSGSGRVLFTGTSTGAVRAIGYPLPLQTDWFEYHAHSAAISKMVVTFDDQFLLTASEDGCLLIWKISGQKRDSETSYAEEVLVTKSDLEEKTQVMLELKTRVEELKMENEYQLRLKDMNYSDKIKELTEKFIQQVESLKAESQVLRREKEKQKETHEKTLEDLEERHSREQQDFESTHNQKLLLEYERYEELRLKSQRMQEDYEHRLQQVEEAGQRALEDITVSYEDRLQEKVVELDQCQEESCRQVQEFEQMKLLLEEDGDQEIHSIRLRYEKMLQEEKETNARLKADSGIMKKKCISLQTDVKERNTEILRLKEEQQKLEGVIRSLEKDVLRLKRDIQERDETIQSKEKRIYDLKRKKEELEKFKFVLDYKIEELKKQIEPRENEMKEMKEQIQEVETCSSNAEKLLQKDLMCFFLYQMESEAEEFHKKNTQLEINLAEMKHKLKATDKEMHKEMQKVKKVEALVHRFKTDLHQCVGFIQEPKKLKDSVRELYERYVQQSDVAEIVGVDADIQREHGRQKELLERNVASLKKKLAKDSEVHRVNKVKIMKENVTLIKEINELRQELRGARTHLSGFQSQESVGKRRRSFGARSPPDTAERLAQLPRAEVPRPRTEIPPRPTSSDTRLPAVVT